MSKQSEFDERELARDKTFGPQYIKHWPAYGESKEFDLLIEQLIQQLRDQIDNLGGKI